MALREVAPGRIYVVEHPVDFAGGRLLTRMTLIVLAGGGIVIHSPIPFDDALRAETAQLGEVVAIVAPSTLHHLFVADAQRAFPDVPTYAVTGLAAKRPDLALTLLPDALWSGEIDRVTVGNRIMREIVMWHRASRTVIAVDLVENIGDATPGTDRVMRMWIKVMGMWNKPRAAPELRWLTRDRAAARSAIEQILAWDFDRMVIAHGELYEHGAKDALREAWRFVLGPARS
ncbi:MAG: hypothetical protein ACRELY_32860 [Polyangiaceae bacterium]